MEKVVNEAHRSKFQTLEQFYTPEDLLVFAVLTIKTVSGIYASGLIRMADPKRIF